MNHLGVEVGSTEEVAAASALLSGAGLATAEESGACCFAEQEKVWVDGPDGEPWEVYTVLGDAEHPQGRLRSAEPGQASACCSTVTEEAAVRLCCR